MKRLIREIRLALFIWILDFAVIFLPKDAIETWQWIKNLPFQE